MMDRIADGIGVFLGVILAAACALTLAVALSLLVLLLWAVTAAAINTIRILWRNR